MEVNAFPRVDRQYNKEEYGYTGWKKVGDELHLYYEGAFMGAFPATVLAPQKPP